MLVDDGVGVLGRGGKRTSLNAKTESPVMVEHVLVLDACHTAKADVVVPLHRRVEHRMHTPSNIELEVVVVVRHLGRDGNGSRQEHDCSY